VQRVDERLLELVGRDRGEAVAGDLAELGPDCDLAARSDERGGLGRARQTARDDAIERAASACPRPSGVSGTSSGETGRPFPSK
jgi:hypothetical protein